jgi:type IV secretion system protein TrbF
LSMEIGVEIPKVIEPAAVESRDTRENNRPIPGNPYLVARREWDERYGNLITRAKNWRLAAILCAAIALVQAAGMIWLSVRSKIVPYVVAVDSLGRQVAAGIVEETSAADDRLKRAALFEWVGDLRMVTNDGVAQRKAIERVYARVANGSQAMTLVNEFFRNDPPQNRAQTLSVSVDVQSVLATSDKTYQVEWIETSRNLRGEVQSQDRWRGAFTIAINPPTDERWIRSNPIGIYVTNVSWTKVVSTDER